MAEDPAVGTGVYLFSNPNYIKPKMFPSLSKNRFTRKLTEDYKTILIQFRFYLNIKLDSFEIWSTIGTKSGGLPVKKILSK